MTKTSICLIQVGAERHSMCVWATPLQRYHW